MCTHRARLIDLLKMLFLSGMVILHTCLGRVYYVDNLDARASDSNPGTHDLPLRSISRAASIAVAGDTVSVLPGGVYRERVAPKRGGTEGKPIQYVAQAHPDKPAAAIRGSVEVPPDRWTHRGDGTWEAEIEDSWLDTVNGTLYNPFALRLAYPAREAAWDTNRTNGSSCMYGYTLGQVFQDGEPLWEVGYYTPPGTDTRGRKGSSRCGHGGAGQSDVGESASCCGVGK